MRSLLIDFLHDLTSLAAAAVFVTGAGLSVMAFAPPATDGHQSAACELAAAEPTDFNIEQCTGEPIDLAPARRTDAG